MARRTLRLGVFQSPVNGCKVRNSFQGERIMKHYAGCLMGSLLVCCGAWPDAPLGEIAAEEVPSVATSQLLDALPTSTPDAPLSGCDLAGPWLLELSIPVRWEANAQIVAGTGRVRLRATSQRKAAGNLLIDGLTPCAMALPSTERKSGAHVRTKFSEKAFAQGAHTITPAITSIRSNLPGARFRMQPFALQYGAIVANPTMAPWPEDITGNAVDVDSDGHPGVTMRIATTEQGMVRDPVSQLYVAWRVVLRTAGGKIESCDGLQGLGAVPSLGQQLAVNLSVMGCAKRSGTQCSAAEAEMAANWLPPYLKDGNAAVSMTRLQQDTPGACAPF